MSETQYITPDAHVSRHSVASLLYLFLSPTSVDKNDIDSSISSLTVHFVALCSLQYNQIGDEGGKGLGEGLKHNTSLQMLM